MTVTEARRVRHLVIRVNRGEELPAVLLRALNELEVRAAWITGAGTLEAAEIALYDQVGREYGRARRLDTPCGLASLVGNAALADGVLSLQLSATLTRETDSGLQALAGELVWARAFAVDVHVTAFDDLSLTRAYDERTGLGALTARAASPASASEAAARAPMAATPVSVGAVAAASSTAGFRSSMGGAAAPGSGSSNDGPTRPQRPSRAQEDVEVYPEVGDAAAHFHFGECTVIGSDGDRIRLRQERDGRVREVSLTMLRIESPTLDASGKRHFVLSRKN